MRFFKDSTQAAWLDRIDVESDTYWSCPLYGQRITEGLCVEINYQRLGLFDLDVLEDAVSKTGKTLAEINGLCENCPNYPLPDED